MSRYALGIDFGTESGRAVLVDCADGRELGTQVYRYRNGVIDERLPPPDDDVRLERDELVDVIGRGDADRRNAAELADVLAHLLGAVGIAPNQLEVRLRQHGAHR